MRLIDADALKKEWSMGDVCEMCVQDTRKCGNDYCFSRMDVCGMIDDAPTVGGWISVKDRMPDSNHVLARCEIHGLYKPKSYTCVAFYAKKNSISVGNCFDDEICCEYDEETDEYYLKEGWYEVIRNWDEYGSVVIGDFVTHWMPLPEPPET